MNISDNSGTKALIENATVEVAINNPEKFPSVREICEKAHIDRSTFYYHFRSIDQLFDYIEDIIHSKIKVLLTNAPYEFNERFFVPVLVDIVENAALYKLCLFQVRHATSKLGLFQDYFEIFKKQCMKNGIKNDKEVVFLFNYVQSGCVGCIRTWVKTGFTETPEEMSEILLNCLPDALK